MERRDSIKGRFNVIIVRSGYVDECWQRKGKQVKNSKEEANVGQDGDFDSDPVLLMVTIGGGDLHSEAWYLDIGCSNHMVGRKDWLIDLDTSKKTQIKLADSKALTVEG